MGLRGPLPADDNVRVLRGGGTERGPQPSVKAPPKPPNPPTWLDREGAAEWRRVVPELNKLGLLALVDRAVLATYCDVWSRFVEARRLLSDGLVVKNRDDRGPVKNPAWQIYRDSATLLYALAKDLGVAPGARLRMRAPGGGNDDEGEGEGILD